MINIKIVKIKRFFKSIQRLCKFLKFKSIISIIIFHFIFSCALWVFSDLICYIFKFNSGFAANSTLISISFTLFGFAVTAKNILNHKLSEFYSNIPIMTIIDNSKTVLYKKVWYSILFSPVFMLVLFCLKYDINLVPYIFLSFICFLCFLIETYRMISLKNTQDVISDMLLNLTANALSYNNQVKRKNLLSSLYSVSRKNILSSDYKPIFNEYICKVKSVLNGSYEQEHSLNFETKIKKDVHNSIKSSNTAELIVNNICYFIYDYVNYVLLNDNINYQSVNNELNDFTNSEFVMKNLIDSIFNFNGYNFNSDLMYKFYINSILGLYVAVLKNTNAFFFSEICDYVINKISNKQNINLYKFYLLGYNDILICLTIEYCIVNEFIHKEILLCDLIKLFDNSIKNCNSTMLDQFESLINCNFEISISKSSIRKLLLGFNMRLNSFEKNPVF